MPSSRTPRAAGATAAGSASAATTPSPATSRASRSCPPRRPPARAADRPRPPSRRADRRPPVAPRGAAPLDISAAFTVVLGSTPGGVIHEKDRVESRHRRVPCLHLSRPSRRVFELLLL